MGANTCWSTQKLGNPETTEPDYTDAEREFLVAVDRYKRSNRRPFPTWREVFRVLCSLGYRQTQAVEPLPRFVRHKGQPCIMQPSSSCL